MIILLKATIHYALHFLVPGAIAWRWYRPEWKKAWVILIATMLVDLDHLLSTPIFDPNRLSIGNHILHSYPAILLYTLLMFSKKTRLIAVGLLFHMLTDTIDYFLLGFT